jgi:hypothetical protein
VAKIIKESLARTVGCQSDEVFVGIPKASFNGHAGSRKIETYLLRPEGTRVNSRGVVCVGAYQLPEDGSDDTAWEAYSLTPGQLMHPNAIPSWNSIRSVAGDDVFEHAQRVLPVEAFSLARVNSIVNLTPKNSFGHVVLTLDAGWQNAPEFGMAGIVEKVYTGESDPNAALVHNLCGINYKSGGCYFGDIVKDLARGAPETEALRSSVSVAYLDYCGAVQPKTRAALASLRELQVYGISYSTRNTTRDPPCLDGFVHCGTQGFGQMRCAYFIRGSVPRAPDTFVCGSWGAYDWYPASGGRTLWKIDGAYYGRDAANALRSAGSSSSSSPEPGSAED